MNVSPNLVPLTSIEVLKAVSLSRIFVLFMRVIFAILLSCTEAISSREEAKVSSGSTRLKFTHISSPSIRFLMDGGEKVRFHLCRSTIDIVEGSGSYDLIAEEAWMRVPSVTKRSNEHIIVTERSIRYSLTTTALANEWPECKWLSLDLGDLRFSKSPSQHYLIHLAKICSARYLLMSPTKDAHYVIQQKSPIESAL